MDVIHFHNPVEYITWVNDHKNNGYVVVVDNTHNTNKWTIHYPDCHHITNPINNGDDLMSYDKYGSLNPERLGAAAAAAAANGGYLSGNCYCQTYGTDLRPARN